MAKDFDGKLLRMNKALQQEFRSYVDSAKEDILSQILDQMQSNFKNEMMKVFGDKIKDSQKHFERQV